MILFDYIGNRACEEAEKKFREYLKRDELQRILLQCFKDMDVEINENIEQKIYNIKSEQIKPNMSKEEIELNLKDIFLETIDKNEMYYGKSQNTKSSICAEYLKRSRKNILELYHIMDVLDDVKADLIKLIRDGEKQQETFKKIDELHEELLKRTGNEIRFIEELDTSKVYFYCEVEVCTYYQGIEETFIDIFEQLKDDTSALFIENHVFDEIFCTIYIQFTEPLVQYKFRDFLKHMNSLFAREEIMISKITTHF